MGADRARADTARPAAAGEGQHADLLQAHDGSWWAVFLAARPVPYPNRTHLGRETFMAPMHWAEDGWSLIGDGGRVALYMDVPTKASTLLSFNPRKDEEEAGLTVFMNERFHYDIAITREAGQKMF